MQSYNKFLPKYYFAILLGVTNGLYQSTYGAAQLQYQSTATKQEWDTLLKAIETGNLNIVQGLIPSKIRPLERTKTGRSILDIAIHHNQPAIIRYLAWEMIVPAIEMGDIATVQKIVPTYIGINEKTKGNRSLHSIASYHKKGNIEAYLLKQQGATYGQNPLSTPAPQISTYTQPATNLGAIEFYDSNASYYEFTNFYTSPIVLKGKTWPTTEHYFQAQKFTDPNIQEEIRTAKTARDVFNLANGRTGKYKHLYDHTAWNTKSIAVMKEALQAKFTQHPALKKMLLSTGNRDIIEASPHDDFWGWGKNKTGRNELGKLLVIVREELKKEITPAKNTHTKQLSTATTKAPSIQDFFNTLESYKVAQQWGTVAEKTATGEMLLKTYLDLSSADRTAADNALKKHGITLF